MDGTYVRQDTTRPRLANRFREFSTADLFSQILEDREEKDRERAIALLKAAASSEPLFRSDEIR